MSNPVSRAGLAGALVIAWAPAAVCETADLRPKFPKDRVTYYRTITEISQNVETPHRSTQTNIRREYGIRLTVKNIHPDGSADVEYALLYVALHRELYGSPWTIDTRRPAEYASDPAFAGFTAMLNKPILLHISPADGIKGITGAEALLETLAPQAAHLIREDHLREQQHLRMPGRNAAHPTGIGSTWQDQLETPIRVGKRVHSTTYTLKSVDPKARTAEIAAEGTVRIEPASGAPVAVSVDDAKSSGRLTWDLAKGEVARLESEMLTTTTRRRQGDQSDAGIIAKHRQTTKTTMERVTVKDLDLHPGTTGDNRPKDEAENVPSDR